MTNTQSFAKRELDILSKSSTDPNNRPLIEPFAKEILLLAEKFGKSGQSGGSAPMTATAISHAVKKLLLQEPICPITGIEGEWMNVAEYGGGKDEKHCVWQNNRCGCLFMGVNKKPYYLDAIIWKTQNEGTFCGSTFMPDGSKILSRQYVKSFPFTPKTFYIDVIEKEVKKDDWELYVKDERQLKKVFKYYDKYII